MRTLNRLFDEEDGSALIYIALVLLVLCGFAAIAIDGSNAYYQRRRMQTAADAAAYAGARQLALGKSDIYVEDAVRGMAEANGADTYSWTKINGGKGINVQVSNTFPTYFARVLDFNLNGSIIESPRFSTLTAGADSQAEYQPVTRMNNLFPMAVDCDCVEYGSNTFEVGGDSEVVAGPSSATITLSDKKNSKFEVNFVNKVGNTWTYNVNEVSGGDLSHWSLGISSCLDHIVTSSPGGASIGTDGSTGFIGIKWEVDDPFSNGNFSITLDGNYPAGTVEALAKAGPQSATANIMGPVCDAGDGLEENACPFTWLDWDGGPTSNMELLDNLDNLGNSGPRSIQTWLDSGPEVQDALQCAPPLEQWSGKPVIIPLFDEVDDSDPDDLKYRICGFAEFVMYTHDFSSNPMWISGNVRRTVVRGLNSAPDGPDYGARDVLLIN
jgi:Flp pilus assembly protein TadG